MGDGVDMDLFSNDYKIDRPIRLIELFAGIGAQAMALRDIGADFTHHRVVEFDSHAVRSYNAIHGTSFTTTDIRDVHGNDLGISDLDKFCYILTYSFPCVDLSLAGKRQGMAKGTGTRSGLLWEVERILSELAGEQHLPQVLLMENVPQVHGEKNRPDFDLWVRFLSSLGYTSRWQDLNARDYGIPQSRNRCFMVSILGDYDYTFPNPVELKESMRSCLESDVDEKYYINSPKAMKLLVDLEERGELDGTGCLGGQSAETWGDRHFHQGDRVYGSSGIAQCHSAQESGGSTKYCVPVGGSTNMNDKIHVREVSCTDCARDHKGVHPGFQEKNVAIVPCDLSTNNPSALEVANCITARENRGICNVRSMGNGHAVPLNTMPDGTCRCIKAQCHKNSAANFAADNGLAATGVVECR